MSDLPSHPDRSAASLRCRSEPGPGPFRAPGPDAASARVPLALLWWQAEQRSAGVPAARAALAELAGEELRLGTVQDPCARGIAARLEEVLSLCPPAAAQSAAAETGEQPDESQEIARGRQAKVFGAKELRRKRELVVTSGGPRLRVSRRDGLQLIDRERELNIPHFLECEDQRDQGCLDRFVPVEGQRPRIFSPANLHKLHFEQSPARDLLVLGGRLGRGPRGFAAELQILGDKQSSGLLCRLRIDNQVPDHRLRVRFAGLRDEGYLQHAGTPEWREVERHGHRHLYATLLRATGRLRVDERFVPTPAAQGRGWIEHLFGIGRAVPVGGWPCAGQSQTVDKLGAAATNWG